MQFRLIRASLKILVSCACTAICMVSAPSFAQDNFIYDKALDKIWMYHLEGFSVTEYQDAIERLIPSYEQAISRNLKPGDKQRVGIKVYTNSGAGITTPLNLVEATILFLESRGYKRNQLFLIDLKSDKLWQGGFIGSRSLLNKEFKGVPVYALDDGDFYDPLWFYDSPLPSQYVPGINLHDINAINLTDYSVLDDGRKSFLPTVLLHDVDFWINLPVVTDHPSLGLNGVLANATLWNISNHYRFLDNIAGASAAIAEIAAIPELSRTLVFSLVSMEKFQFMGGPSFNAHYVRSQQELYLSGNPVGLDFLFLEKLNRARFSEGFAPIPTELPVFEYSRSLGLGDYQRDLLDIIEKKSYPARDS